jgi:hypothetical protein
VGTRRLTFGRNGAKLCAGRFQLLNGDGADSADSPCAAEL